MPWDVSQVGTLAAVISVALSVIALIVSIVALRVALPRVKLRAYAVKSSELPGRLRPAKPTGWTLFIQLDNRGRAATTVHKFAAGTYLYWSRPRWYTDRLTEVDGPDLPFRLEGKSVALWIAPNGIHDADAESASVQAWVGRERKTVQIKGRRTAVDLGKLSRKLRIPPDELWMLDASFGDVRRVREPDPEGGHSHGARLRALGRRARRQSG